MLLTVKGTARETAQDAGLISNDIVIRSVMLSEVFVTGSDSDLAVHVGQLMSIITMSDCI